MSEEIYDCIIIGGGAAGTACAALLSHWGFQVLLLEKNAHLGGRASTLHLPNKFLVDTGVHGIPYYDLGSLKKIETILNVKFDLVDYKPLLAFYDVEEELCVEVVDFSNAGFKEVDRIWGQNGTFLKLLNFLRNTSESHADELDSISVEEYFGSWSPHLQFRQLLTAINGMITITPTLGSAGEFIRSFSKLFSSTRPITYPRDGGIQSLSEKMAEICRDNKGTIMTSAKVTSIIIENGAIKGVKAEIKDENHQSYEETLLGNSVIVTIPLQFLFEIVSKDHFSESFIHQIQSLHNKQSCAQGIGFMFKEDLLQAFPWDPKCWGAILFFPKKKPRYLSVPSALVEGLAPPGKHYLFYGVVSTPDEVHDKQASRALIKELISEINILFPKLKEYKEFHFSGSSEMVLGTAKRVGMTGQFKPKNECEDVKGLFFAGDTAEGNGPGLECTYDSALKCSKKVCNWLNERNRNRKI
ncbi:MAG: phytoene desaturase family protein [Candidatus Helarchaeota archaeon]